MNWKLNKRKTYLCLTQLPLKINILDIESSYLSLRPNFNLRSLVGDVINVQNVK